MKKVLSDLSSVSIELGDIAYSSHQIENNWIGFEPAKRAELESAQQKLSLKLPEDYVEFLEITNGLSAPNQVEPSFLPIEEIDYLKSVDPHLIEVWLSQESLSEIAEQLERSVMVGGKDEEQYFLLIPPKEEQEIWKYWTFSSWAPGETEYSDLKSYFQEVLEFNKAELEK